jgi:hypothetical protein
MHVAIEKTQIPGEQQGVFQLVVCGPRTIQFRCEALRRTIDPLSHLFQLSTTLKGTTSVVPEGSSAETRLQPLR